MGDLATADEGRRLGTGNRTDALYRDDGGSSARCRSLGMTRAFSPSPVVRPPSPAVASRQSPVASPNVTPDPRRRFGEA